MPAFILHSQNVFHGRLFKHAAEADQPDEYHGRKFDF